jgi:integrase
MAREATGELRRSGDGFAALITIEGRTRSQFSLDACRTEHEARERCRALASMAARLRHAGHAAEIESLLAMGAKARPGKPWEAVVAAVDALCSGQTGDNGTPPPTVAEWGRQWVTGELARKYPDHVRAKRWAGRDEELLRLYVHPHVVDVRVDAFTLEHAEYVMANLPDNIARSRRQVAQVMSRLMNLAVYPGKWIKASPIPRGWLPSPPAAKAKECLYPDEDALLLGGLSVETGKAGRLPDVPLLRRLAYGFLAREGMRADEMANLRWLDVDLTRGRVNLDRDKTDDPRDWDLRADVVDALKRWKIAFQPNAEPADPVFAENGVPIHVEHLAHQIRCDLRRVGVTRPQLFESSETRQRFRAHDLRATFVTIALATGKTETWVSDRTGHDGHTMIDKYRRKARTWNVGELGRLDQLIPELRALAERKVRITTPLPLKITARVAKQADAADLGSAAARRKGSTPFPCTFQ